MLTYPIVLTPDEDTLLVTCPDLPEATSFGEDEAQALRNAVGGIEETLAARIHDGRDIPAPKPRRTKHSVSLSTQTAMKVELYWRLRQEGITRAELMRRLGWHREQVDRLFRLDHATRLDQFDAAFKALGRELSVMVTEPA